MTQWSSVLRTACSASESVRRRGRYEPERRDLDELDFQLGPGEGRRTATWSASWRTADFRPRGGIRSLLIPEAEGLVVPDHLFEREGDLLAGFVLDDFAELADFDEVIQQKQKKQLLHWIR